MTKRQLQVLLVLDVWHSQQMVHLHLQSAQWLTLQEKTYYVSRILAKVTTAFVGCDELVVSDGTNTLMTTTDADLSEGGLYIVDLGFEVATTGGATITGTLQNSGSSASPTTGAIIVTAEYKQI